MSTLLFSILTPALPSRLGALEKLMADIARQIGELPVEHLVLLDNKRRTVGEKRDALLRAARGEYLAFVDDDDQVSEDYVSAILQAIQESRPDVVTFDQHVVYNGQHGFVEFRLGHPNDEFKPGQITKRNAWHCCPWKRQLAILSHFPATNYGEDFAFASKLWKLDGLREVHIPRILHHYIHSDQTTEAPPPQNLVLQDHDLHKADQAQQQP